ncbi:MAG: hypothetical protein Q8S19_02040 [Bacillota bacterium]|nr:hypothetical protein [Bacillota bacterium]
MPKGPQFQFNTNCVLSENFGGKIVQTIEVCEVASPDLPPVALRMRIHFTDGSYLEVDRKSTELPAVKRKVLHLNLVWQSIQ